MLRIFLVVFSFFFLFLTESQATPYRRLVNFEWEAIEGAASYEVELKQVKTKGEGKTFKFRVPEAAWNGHLAPGKYILKLRSFDRRGVPGDWNAPSDFNVGLETAVLKYPAAQAQIASKEEETAEVNFEWAPVGGAQKYNFELNSDDGKTKISKELEGTKISLKIPVAASYSWKVSSINEEGIESDAAAVSQFTFLGKPLEAPKLQKPESSFVREIKWSRPANVTKFDIQVFKYSAETKKWERYKVFEDYQDDTLAFDPSWPGGKYQIVIRGKSDMRPNSPTARQAFAVRNGDRSPAAEYTALVRSSIERMTGWYAIASYLFTEMQFAGANPEHNSSVSYSAMGGTVRAGLGWFSMNSPWGFLGIVDMSGFTFKGKTRTFASTEMNAVYRMPIGDRAELRFQGGPYYKELPETVGNPFNGTSEDLMISAVGPHAGVEYWYSISPKIGIQVNAHLYYSLMKMSTPNGAPLDPSMSTQFGFLGSYRFSSTLTGLAGYARREDKMSYKAVPSATNFAEPGDVNQSTIVGNYLNIFAEWSF